MKKIYSLLLLCLIGTVSAWAETVTLSPVADTYFSWDDTGVCYGTEETLYCGNVQEMWTNTTPGIKYNYSGSKNIAVFKFDASNYIGKITDATFKVTATNPSTNSAARSIYLGYFDLTNWDETTTTANCGMVTRSATDLNIHTFNLSNSIAKGETKEVSFNSDGLKTYINSDADGIISLIVYSVGQQCTVNSKEAESGTPSLVIEYSNSTFYSVTFNETNNLKPVVTVYSDEARSTSVSSDQLSANTTYYYTATLAGYKNATGSFKIESANTTITLTMEALERYTFTVNAVSGNDVIKPLLTDDTAYDGKTYNVAAPKYLTDDNNAVTYSKNDDTYSYSFTASQTESTKSINYTAYSGTAYFYEGETYNQLGTKVENGNYSDNKAGRGLNNTTMDICTIAETGVYKVSYAICSNNVNADRTYSFYRNSADNTLETKSCNWSVNKVKTDGSKFFNAGLVTGDALQMYASDGNIILDYVLLERTGDLTEDITINSTTRLASYVTTYALDFSGEENLKAYIATTKESERVILSKVTYVPAGTPVIIRSLEELTEDKTYSLPLYESTPDDVSGNILLGHTTESYEVKDGDGIYALSKIDGMMHPVNAGVTIPAKKAYLKTGASAGAKEALKFVYENEEEATAINNATAEAEAVSTKLYNAAGQQVGKGYRGMVIDSNGKKSIR